MILYYSLLGKGRLLGLVVLVLANLRASEFHQSILISWLKLSARQWLSQALQRFPAFTC